MAPPSGPPLLIALKGPIVGEIYALTKEVTVLGRDDGADLLIDDPSVSRRHVAIRLVPESRPELTDLGSSNGTRVNGTRILATCELAPGDKIEIGDSVLRLSSPGDAETHHARQMQQAALRDPLTGVYNRRYLDERLLAELAFAKRHVKPLALMLLDIDHFKDVNDTHGHPIGDVVLQEVARRLAGTVRAEDVVARYGGEEFAVVCRETEESNATVLAERIRRLIADTPVESDGESLRVTVSLGVVAYAPKRHDAPWQLVRDADVALYAAKGAGRDQVVRFTDHPADSA